MSFCGQSYLAAYQFITTEMLRPSQIDLTHQEKKKQKCGQKRFHYGTKFGFYLQKRKPIHQTRIGGIGFPRDAVW
jgi:hypothetical protein